MVQLDLETKPLGYGSEKIWSLSCWLPQSQLSIVQGLPESTL